MVSFAAKKQVLLVGNDGIQLYVVEGKRTSLYGDYSNSGGALANDLKAAFRTVKAPLILLFDVVEQQYRKEAIPKVGFLDKTKVIKRKLSMAFPAGQMRAYLPLKQTPKADESLVALFAGLPPSLISTQILDAVIGSEIGVDGAVLLPVESANMTAKLVQAAHKRAATPDDTRWSVLMTYHKTGGLRQIVIKDGELALTRLTPLAVDPGNTNALAEEMAREFNSTLTYLSRFGYAPSDGLDLIVVSSDAVVTAMRNYRLAVSHFYAMSGYDAGELLGVTPVLQGDDAVYGDALHAAWTGSQRKLTMPLSAPAFDKVLQSRQIARFAIFILICLLGYLAYQTFDVQTKNAQVRADIVDLKTRKLALQNQFDALSKQLNTLEFPPEKIAPFLAINDMLHSKDLAIEPTLQAVIASIDKGNVQLRTITVEPPGQNNGGAAAAVTAAIPGSAPGQPANVPDKADMVITLKFAFTDGMPVDQAARVTNDLKQRLQSALPGRDIAVSQMIGNLAVNQAMRGVSEVVAPSRVEGRDVKTEETSTITIKGDVL